MSKRITQDMAYRQSLMKYAEKYGVSCTSRPPRIFVYKSQQFPDLARIAARISRRAQRAHLLLSCTIFDGHVHPSSLL